MNKLSIAVVGLGYVGLPLLAALDKHFPVIGFDVDIEKITRLKSGEDTGNELSAEALQPLVNKISADAEILSQADIYIVTVPTPIDSENKPDLAALRSASKIIGQYIQKNNIVIYESTVYPGVTEQVCLPILQEQSGLKCNDDFAIGYSPERISPSDKDLHSVVKLVSASNPEALNRIKKIYEKIVQAGVYTVSSIRIAEASKLLENIQRDVNIALVNEFAAFCAIEDIDSGEVLDAAASKWNFMSYSPGLVGGHCIGVDPCYFTHRAYEIGFKPNLVETARCVNDAVAYQISYRLQEMMSSKNITLQGSRVLIMGFSFKKDCADCRNTKIFDIVKSLEDVGVIVEIYDPIADRLQARAEYQQEILTELPKGVFDAICIAVDHKIFRDMGIECIKRLSCKNSIVFDVKSLFNKQDTDARL